MNTELVQAFVYGKGWRAEKVVRALYPEMKYQSREFVEKRQEVVKIIVRTEKALNAKEIRLIDLLEGSDEVLRKYYLEHGTINLSKIDN